VKSYHSSILPIEVATIARDLPGNAMLYRVGCTGLNTGASK
jgi:hypothetical protein